MSMSIWMDFLEFFLSVVEGMHKCSSAVRSSCLNVETELRINDVVNAQVQKGHHNWLLKLNQ